MRALIVYDSKFGNTREIAIRIGDAMQEDGDVEVSVQPTEEFTGLPDDLDLLVIGGPTQTHGVEATMRRFLDSLPAESLAGVTAAVFDTRMHWPKVLSGSAADGIAKRLERLGAALVDGPESFFVQDKEGPLREGETDRAVDWGWFLMKEMKIRA